MAIQQTGLGCASCKTPCGSLGDWLSDRYGTGVSTPDAPSLTQDQASDCPYGSNGSYCNPPDQPIGTPMVSCPTGYVSYNGQCITIAQQQALANPVPVPIVMTYTPKVSLVDSTSGSSLSGLRGALGAFTVGDAFTVNVTGGQPNTQVAVSTNGSNFQNMGVTDSNGSWSTSGHWDSSNVGRTGQLWQIGGVVANPLVFTVDPSVVTNQPVPVTQTPVVTPVATVAYSPKVSLIDNTSGSSLSGLRGLAGFVAGDTFTVRIDGAQPITPVYVQQVKNGSSLPVTQMGTTDSNGSFIVTGQWQASDVGLYTQYWKVGTQNVNPSPLMFTVTPLTVGSQVPVITNGVIPDVNGVLPVTSSGVMDWITANPLATGGIGLGAIVLLMWIKGK